jgi:hypothetical protein
MRILHRSNYADSLIKKDSFSERKVTSRTKSYVIGTRKWERFSQKAQPRLEEAGLGKELAATYSRGS